MQEDQAKKTSMGLIWAFAEKFSTQIVSTVISIILARLLTPDAYGTVAIVAVLIALFNVFVTGGFSTALVQKKDADDVDFCTTFWLSLVASLVCYALLFFLAPVLAAFYEVAELTLIIRVMGLQLPASAMNSIQQAKMQRSLEFKKIFVATLIGVVISGSLGLVLAYNGAGVWALVAQNLTSVVLITLILFFVARWVPKFRFSWKKLKEIWSYGWKVLVTQLVYTLEGDVRSLTVGKVFGSADLAYYDQGKKYPTLLVNNITSSIDRVMLPTYSREQDNREKALAMIRRSIRTGIYILAPIVLGLAMVAESFVIVFLTDKWIECVPYLQILCISCLTRPLESSCHQALLSIGKSGTVLGCMIAINAVGLSTVVFSVFVLRSVLAIALFSILTTLISLCVFLTLTKKYFGYSFKNQFKDILPSIGIALIMSIAVLACGLLSVAPLVKLILQIGVGALTYLALSICFKLEPFTYLLRFIKRWRKK